MSICNAIFESMNTIRSHSNLHCKYHRQAWICPLWFSVYLFANYSFIRLLILVIFGIGSYLSQLMLNCPTNSRPTLGAFCDLDLQRSNPNLCEIAVNLIIQLPSSISIAVSTLRFQQILFGQSWKFHRIIQLRSWAKKTMADTLIYDKYEQSLQCKLDWFWNIVSLESKR